MSFDLDKFTAEPSVELLNLGKKTDLLNLAKHYKLSEIKSSMRKHEIKNILVQYFVDGEIFNENALSLIVDVQSVSSSKELELKFQIRQSENQEREKEREREEREKEREREREREREEREEREKEIEREREREREKREEREKEREFQLRMREIEMQERANQPKQKIEYNFDVTKHIRLVPPFQEKVDKYFLHFEKVAENLNWAKKHWTLLLQSVLIGKARKIYTQLGVELGVIIMRLLKNLFSKVMSWSQKHIDKNLEIVKKILTRLMLNLLETKNSYLIDGAVLRK